MREGRPVTPGCRQKVIPASGERPVCPSVAEVIISVSSFVPAKAQEVTNFAGSVMRVDN